MCRLCRHTKIPKPLRRTKRKSRRLAGLRDGNESRAFSRGRSPHRSFSVGQTAASSPKQQNSQPHRRGTSPSASSSEGRAQSLFFSLSSTPGNGRRRRRKEREVASRQKSPGWEGHSGDGLKSRASSLGRPAARFFTPSQSLLLLARASRFCPLQAARAKVTASSSFRRASERREPKELL